ncbi:MAG: glycosyltransferase family 2 protein [Proteobacteria bacterium]|nr:glycosyltransferase family 2 protein [Pseudomonadota bacterium]
MAAVSVCVIACDEQDRLPGCLDSLGFADEVVVLVDAKSADDTEKIARAAADRVEVRAYDGDIQQKRHCTTLARNDWVFIVDADERVSPTLAAEVAAAVRDAPDDLHGFEVNRLTRHLGRWIRHGDFYPDWTLRLYRRSRAHWEGRNPHGRIVVAGRVQRLGHDLFHESYRDLADQIDRIQFFSGEAAGSLDAAGRRVRLVDLVLRPPARFARAYWLKRGFLDGVPGFIIAVNTAFHVFLKYAKLWERRALARVDTDGRR